MIIGKKENFLIINMERRIIKKGTMPGQRSFGNGFKKNFLQTGSVFIVKKTFAAFLVTVFQRRVHTD